MTFAVLLVYGLLVAGIGFAWGYITAVRIGPNSEEELSAAYSRGCGDCRCERPPTCTRGHVDDVAPRTDLGFEFYDRERGQVWCNTEECQRVS
jgi:hypothetical protein